jgi:hypothetical protein
MRDIVDRNVVPESARTGGMRESMREAEKTGRVEGDVIDASLRIKTT